MNYYKLTPQQQFGLDRSGAYLTPSKAKKSGLLYNLSLDGLIVEWSKPYAVMQTIKKAKYSHVFPINRLKIVKS